MRKDITVVAEPRDGRGKNEAALPAPPLIEKGPQPRISGAAHRQLRSIRQHHDVIVLTVRLDLCDLLQIHDVRPVNAKKLIRI